MADDVAARPTEIEVEISSGEVIVVGVLNWGGYKKLGTVVKNRLTKRATEVFANPAFADGGPAMMGPIMAAVDEIISDLTPEFVKACVADSKSLKNVTRPVDWLRLREAAASVNDLQDVLELEGNALMASVTTVMKRVTESQDAGG